MDAWAVLVETLADELGDTTDLEHATRIVLRLALAALFGGLLGF